jgi:hypothetical protein
MIKPHKYLDLNLSLLNLGGIIISIVKQEQVIKYDDLLERLILARGENVREVYLPALTFLYALGKVEYKKDIDVIEFRS